MGRERGKRVALWLCGAAASVCACKREVPIETPRPPDQTVVVPGPALPEPATATALPTSATTATADPIATAEATAPTPTAPSEPTIALYISAGPKGDLPLPIAGQPATVRVTPVGDLGRPIAELEPVLGSLISLLLVRTDLGTVDVIAAPKLSDPARKSHDFKVTFATGGSHVVLVLFKPKDKPLAAVPAFLNVQGPFEPAPLATAASLKHRGKDGLDVSLGLEAEQAEVCEPLRLATAWTRKGKPVRLDGVAAGGAPAVWYFGVQAGRVAVSKPMLALDAPGAPTPTQSHEVTAAIVGDPGTEATLTFTDPGLAHVLAVGRLPGAKPGQVAIARFTLNVAGKARPEGCQ